jgi:tetratricopeptide (TPR) repeat protein
MVKHQAYFEFLASTDQNAPAWPPVLAGLAALRLIDARIGERRGEDDWASIESVRSAANAIPEGNAVRAILLALVDDLAHDDVDFEAVGRGLIAYGRALNFEGRWSLACDVFATADHVTGAPTHPEISIDANVGIGGAARRMADWERSANAYARAAHLAATVGDRARELRAEVGRATTDMVRGNLPAAETLLREVITEARTIKANDVLGQALHSQGSVAHQKGLYGDAVRVLYEALEVMESSAARDGVLSDIAAAFAGMGLYDAARDGYLIVSATSQSQWVRWQATLNLMELSSWERDRARFDEYARQLENEQLDPRLRTAYFMYFGLGERLFGNEEAAQASLSKAVALAEANQLHLHAHEAIEALADVKRTTHSPRVAVVPSALDPSITWIASELGTLRQAALSSA